MTALAGINMGEYAILAADDVSIVHKDGEAHQEISQKIFPVPWGFMTGTGWEPLVRQMAARLNSPEGKTLRDSFLVRWIEKRILAAREDLRELRDHSDITREQYERTRVLVSLVVKGRTEILLYSPDRKEDGFAGKCKIGDIVLTAPGGTPDGVDIKWQADLRKHLRPLDSFGSKLESANYHCKILGAYILQLSEIFDNVSRSGVVGFLTASGEMQAERFPKGTRAPRSAEAQIHQIH